ncbi:MAG: hypothetical protein ACOYB3_13530, partial [Azonexus sp.]
MPGLRRRELLAALIGAVAIPFLSPIHGAEPVPELDQTLVIALRHRPAEEVLPALGPHLGEGRVSLSASGNRILLRGSARDLGPLIDLISAIDVAPRLVWVTVALDDTGLSTTWADDREDAPSETHYTAGGPLRSDFPGDEMSTSSRWHTGRGKARRVLVRDGDWAAVAIRGISPVTGLSAQVQATPQIEVFTSDLAGPGRFQDGGFRVRPRLAGDLVTLDIAVFGSTDDPLARGALVQTLTTTLTGRLGDWISVGGSADLQPTDTTAEIVARTRPVGMPSVLLRVTPAD